MQCPFALRTNIRNSSYTCGRQNPITLSALSEHADVHPAKIGAKPDQPNRDAVIVKIPSGILASANGDYGSPHGMCQHKPQRNLPGQSVQVQQIERPFCHFMHCPRAGDIENKTSPECCHMPSFEVSGNSFRPDAESVKQQRQRNKRGRYNEWSRQLRYAFLFC